MRYFHANIAFCGTMFVFHGKWWDIYIFDFLSFLMWERGDGMPFWILISVLLHTSFPGFSIWALRCFYMLLNKKKSLPSWNWVFLNLFHRRVHSSFSPSVYLSSRLAEFFRDLVRIREYIFIQYSVSHGRHLRFSRINRRSFSLV